MKKTLGFVLVVEAGDLENKTRLLIKSLRTFGGELKDSPIWAVQPRKGKRLSQKTFDTFS